MNIKYILDIITIIHYNKSYIYIYKININYYMNFYDKNKLTHISIFLIFDKFIQKYHFFDHLYLVNVITFLIYNIIKYISFTKIYFIVNINIFIIHFYIHCCFRDQINTILVKILLK